MADLVRLEPLSAPKLESVPKMDFLVLPLEVRLRIYEFFYAHTTLYLSDTPSSLTKRVFAYRFGKIDTTMLLLNKQICREALPILRASTILILSRISRELDLDFLPSRIKGTVTHVICYACSVGYRALQAFTSLQLAEFRQTEDDNEAIVERTQSVVASETPRMLRYPIRIDDLEENSAELVDYKAGLVDHVIARVYILAMRVDFPAWMLNPDKDYLGLADAWYTFKIRVNFIIMPEFIDSNGTVLHKTVCEDYPGLHMVVELPHFRIVSRTLVNK